MKFTAEVYDKSKRCYREVDVEWQYSPITGRCVLKGLMARENIMKDVDPIHIDCVMREIERKAKNLTHDERVELMNEMMG